MRWQWESSTNLFEMFIIRLHCIIRVLAFFFVLIFTILFVDVLKAQQRPALYDTQSLEDIKRSPDNYPCLSSFLKSAQRMTELAPLTVVSKEFTYAPNKHYYCSIAPYSWPDPKNPNGPYITRDGEANPEKNKFDRVKLEELVRRVQCFSVAYYLTGEDNYYSAAINQLKTWFVDEDTKMYPNFEFAQVVKGVKNNKGVAYGLADLSGFNKLIESIMLLDQSKKIDPKLMTPIKEWFIQFQKWLLRSEQWKVYSKSTNNITSTCYSTLVEISLFVGRKRTAKKLAKSFKARIIDVQIDKEGKQPSELKRTYAFGYSVANLREIIDFCLIMEGQGIHFYKQNQRKIDNAFSYLYQFVGHQEDFPYKQIAKWDNYEYKLLKNMKRLTRLEAESSEVQNLARTVQFNANSLLDYVY